MQITSLGEVIAIRRLHVADEDAEAGQVEVIVKLGKPAPFPDSPESYYCPFQITGLGDGKVRYAGGIDGIQAIQEAIRMLGMILYLDLNPKVGNRLRWEGDEHGELGFPHFPA